MQFRERTTTDERTNYYIYHIAPAEPAFPDRIYYLCTTNTILIPLIVRSMLFRNGVNSLETKEANTDQRQSLFQILVTSF